MALKHRQQPMAKTMHPTKMPPMSNTICHVCKRSDASHQGTVVVGSRLTGVSAASAVFAPDGR